ncbi:hypothetical protein LTR66_001366 [Elasticomyces elasticus]|nr:hypothetical protein LTR66_001366 [Elasticomyces elasticus]
MVLSLLILLLSSTAIALVAPALSAQRWDYVIKDKHVVSEKWKQHRRADPDHILRMRIGLKQNNFDELERHLYEISDPSHDRYGQHLSEHEVNALVAPHADALAAVHEWLVESGIRLDQVEYSTAKDWLIIPLPISQVESLLSTNYHVYKHEDTGHEVVRTTAYSVPVHLHEHIEVIQPTNYFTHLRRNTRAWAVPHDASILGQHGYYPPGHLLHGQTRNVSAVCRASSVTNLCLRTLYNTINYVPQAVDRNAIGITAYLNETANISDFHVFLSKQRHDASLSYTFNYTTIDGGINFQAEESDEDLAASRDAEANLDSQTIGGFVYPTPIEVCSIGGSPPFKPDLSLDTNKNEPYLAWLDYILALPNPPRVISTSYGDDEQTVPKAYATRVCQMFARLGARGVSLLFASGDDGVGRDGLCYSNDGKNTPMFLPSFPSSCPPSTGFVSGGGVSNYFATPAYQKQAMTEYIASLDSDFDGLYNKSGRGYPDIAAQGYQYVITYDGVDLHVDGTSASTPTVASVISLVNDALLAAGKPVLGFLNPWLYSVGKDGFTDVTNGSALGCDTAGFPAKPGFDLVTGWGTPDFVKLKGLAGA